MKIFTSSIQTTGGTAFLLAIGIGLATPGIAAAADFDGSRNLLCVPTDAVQCEGAGRCQRTEVESLDIPKFVHVEFKQKRLRGTAEGAESERITPILNVQNLEFQTVIQGAENGRGWSMVIDASTGDMSAAVAGDDIGFVLFGVCQPG